MRLLQPQPGDTPAAVIELVLRALQRPHHPWRDAGWEIIDRFASSALRSLHRGQGGGEPGGWLRGGPWESLPGHREHTVTEADIRGGQALVRATILSGWPEDPPLTCLFTLRRAEEGEHARCWLVEGALRLPPSRRRD